MFQQVISIIYLFICLFIYLFIIPTLQVEESKHGTLNMLTIKVC